MTQTLDQAWNLSQLGTSLVELIGYEKLHSGELIPEDWTPDENELTNLMKAGQETVDDIKGVFRSVHLKEH
jgi:hypothetical protein